MRPLDTAFSHVRALPSSSAAIGQHEHKRRAFSLIEAAIVLGVVGLVIGGIWTAASAVNESLKISSLVRNALLTFQQAEKLITVRVIESFPDNTCPDLTPTMIAAGALPLDYIKTPTEAKHPWGGNFRTTICKWGSTERNLGIYIFSPIPKQVCAKFLSNIANNYKGKGIASIRYSDGTPDKFFSYYPILIDELTQAASVGSILYCGFYIPARPN